MLCSYKLCPNSLSTSKELNFSCPHCQTAVYCSQNCRTLDWDSSHKSSCTGLKSPNTVIPASTSDLDTSTVSSNDAKQKKKTVDDFELVNVPNKTTSDLGKGSYGQVKLVKEKGNPSSKYYAMKVMNINQLKAYSSVEYLKNEIKIQKRLDHPHIVKLHHYFQDKENVYLVLEYAENNNLFFYLRKKKKLTEREAFFFFSQTCLGIDYLHKKGILHRDLKPENLLLDKQGNIKVCDFGWSAEAVGKRNTFCGTIDYMAPEMVQSKPHDFKIDIWSLGILLYELLHGYPPFRGKTNDEKFQSILDKELKFSPEISAEAQELVASLLRSDPLQRPGFEYIFNHPWIKKFEKEFRMNLKDYITDKSKKSSKSKSPTPSNPSTPKAQQITIPVLPTESNFAPLSTPSQQTLDTTNNKTQSISPRNLDFQPRSVSPLNNSNISQGGGTPLTRSQNNLEPDYSSPSKMKGVNKAEEMIQNLFQKPTTPRDQSKSPPRTGGIFSPMKHHNFTKDIISPAVADILNKRKTTQDNPLQNDFEPQKRKTTNDISVTGYNLPVPRSNKFLQENPPSTNIMTLNTGVEKTTSSPLQRSPPQDFLSGPNNMAQAVKASDPNVLKKTNVVDETLDLNESMAQQGNPVIGVSISQTNNHQLNVQKSSSSSFVSETKPQLVDLSEYKDLLTSHSTDKIHEKSPQRVIEQQQQQQQQPQRINISPEKPKNQFLMNAPPVQASSVNEVKPETHQNPFITPPQIMKSPQKADHSPRVTRDERSKSPKGYGQTMPRESEFIVPKAENIDNLLTSFNKGKKRQEFETPMNYAEDTFQQEQQEEQFSMERISTLLERSQIQEVDSIVEKMWRNEENKGLLTDKLEDSQSYNEMSYEVSTAQNKMPKFSPEKKAFVQEVESERKNKERSPVVDRVSRISRVTNIERHLEDYEIEDTEENRILDKLDNFYSTGKFEDKERQQIKRAKKEPAESPVESYKTPKAFEMSFAESLKEIPAEPEVPKRSQKLASVEEKEETQASPLKKFETKQEEYNDQEEFMRDYMSQDRKSKSKSQSQSKLSKNEEDEEELEERYQRNQRDQQQQQQEGRKQKFFYSEQKNISKKLEDSEGRNRSVSGTKSKDQGFSSQSPMKKKYGNDYEGQREDLLKNYRNKLKGIYGLSAEKSSSSGSNRKKYSHRIFTDSKIELGEREQYEEKVVIVREKSREKENYGKDERIKEEQVEEEEEEEEERGPRFGRKYDNRRDISRGKDKSQEKNNRNYRPGRREEEDLRRDKRTPERDVDYYMMQAIAGEKKTIDESYDEMRRKKKQLEFYMDDMDLGERESVSRPSYRTMREIPRHHSSKSEQQQEPGLFKKFTQMFGCLERTEKRPPAGHGNSRKGKRVY